eukprot:scaffold15798_cov40-Cyclotella_meneghiniana.AAC.7
MKQEENNTKHAYAPTTTYTTTNREKKCLIGTYHFKRSFSRSRLPVDALFNMSKDQCSHKYIVGCNLIDKTSV